MGTGIEANAVGISILASGILPLPLPDRVPSFRYWTGSDIGIFVHCGTGLTGCRTVLHFLKNNEGGKVYKLYILYVQTAGGGKGYTLHTCMLLVFYLMYVEKS